MNTTGPIVIVSNITFTLIALAENSLHYDNNFIKLIANGSVVTGVESKMTFMSKILLRRVMAAAILDDTNTAIPQPKHVSTTSYTTDNL